MARLRPGVDPDQVRQVITDVIRELRNARGLGAGAFTPPERLAFRDRYLHWVRWAEARQRSLFADDTYLVALHTRRYFSLLDANDETSLLSGLINDEIDYQEQRLRDLADDTFDHDDDPKQAEGLIGLSGLHDTVRQASAALMLGGHREQAVLAAFRAVEARVRAVTGLDDTGRSLMGRAFGGSLPPVRVDTLPGRLGQDEQDGFKLLFMGAMAALRNLAAHGPTRQPSAQEAFEALALASLLLRRLDVADGAGGGKQP